MPVLLYILIPVVALFVGAVAYESLPFLLGQLHMT